MSQIIVAHPGLQHAHQMAWALHERGLLQEFVSGVPVLGDGEPPPAWMPSAYARRLKSVGIPSSLRRHPIRFPALLRARSIFPRGISREDYAHRIFHLFDWWASKRVAKLRPKAVVAYENSAYYTFRAAKEVGARCILDASAFHHSAVERLMPVKETRYLPEINRRKDEELKLADLVLTCSPLAAESYVEGGVPPSLLQSVLLGATIPCELPSRPASAGPLQFIYAGGIRRLKGVDIILEALRRLHAEALHCRVRFVGGLDEPQWRREIEKTPGASYIGSVPQSELFNLFAQADCLLLPSRFDSFGMVVAEAMACGTPAVVSEHTGAKAMIERFPRAGWIASNVNDGLFHCLKSMIRNPGELLSARPYALEASTHFTWRNYRERVGFFIEGWVRS